MFSAAEQAPQRQAVMAALGDYLRRKRLHEEAGLTYLRADLPDKAADALGEALAWKWAMVAARKAGWPPAQVLSFGTDLAGRLVAVGRPRDAAMLLETHCSDDEGAVAAYALAGAWDDAFRLVEKAQRPDLLETHVRPGIEQRAQQYLEEIKALVQAFVTHSDRLQVVREEKRQAAARFDMDAGDDLEDREDDLYSDASTQSQARWGGGMQSTSSGSQFTSPFFSPPPFLSYFIFILCASFIIHCICLFVFD